MQENTCSLSVLGGSEFDEEDTFSSEIAFEYLKVVQSFGEMLAVVFYHFAVEVVEEDLRLHIIGQGK